jgi:hypothetical protein
VKTELSLRRVFGPKREEVVGGWRRLHNLHASLNIIRAVKSRITRLMEHVQQMGEMKNAYKILVGKPEWKRPFGRPRCT